MAKFRFDGRVFPKAYQITLRDLPTSQWLDSETGKTLKTKFSIIDSTVSIDCEMDGYDEPTDLARVFMRAFDLVRATVDLVAFKIGIGTTVIIETYTNPSGEVTHFVPESRDLGLLCTAYQLGSAPSLAGNHFNTILTIVLQDWQIFMALRDTIESITVPHVSTVNCARAIERIRYMIAPNMPRGQAWAEMRNTLQISGDYLKLITDISTGPRHGDPTHVPGKITTEIARRTWITMNRFLEYKKRNAGPLPVGEFPLLTG